MAQQIIAPVIPNLGLLENAIAGSQAITFTATDRKIIEERSGGEINKARSFLEVFTKKDHLAPKVENEQSTVKPYQDVKELDGRYRDHKQMLKHAAVILPHERVEITNETPEEQLLQLDSAERVAPIAEKQEEENEKEKSLRRETSAIAKELNLNPAEVFDKFTLEQEQLYSLIYRIKELHLKRLLSADRKEFKKLSEAIKRETLAAARPEARAWVESQLENLTRMAEDYKTNLQKSLQSINLL